MFINFIISGICLGVGALYPETYLCFFLFLVAAITYRLGFEHKRIYLGSFISGVLFHAIAFYWLCQTVQVFGGLSPLLGFSVMTLFCVTAALQFVLAAYFYKTLREVNFLGSLALPGSWLVATMILPKMFPWEIANGLIVFKSIASLAEFVGVPLLSALFFWWACVLVEFRNYKLIIKCVIISIIFCAIGAYRNFEVQNEIFVSPEVEVAMIQGNLSTEVKGKQAHLQANLNRYLELSKLDADLIVWPESVVSKWLHRDLANLEQVDLNFGLNLLFGGLVYDLRSQEEVEAMIQKYPELNKRDFLQSYSVRKFNAAIGVEPNGNIVGQYYKKVLMPFGEYFPFSERYPWLKEMFPMIADFTPGDIIKPISFAKNIKVGTLICYEDLVPSLSANFVREGANILINLTNDAWYGKTPASHQHHLLALWRAIESRRFLLRSTNTGYTAVVSPFGETINTLPIFEEGVLKTKVRLLELKSFYSVFQNWASCLIVCCVFVLFLRRRLF